MQRREFANVAESYDYYSSDEDADYLQGQYPQMNAQYAQYYQDDIEDFEDEYSSPCPIQRTPQHHQTALQTDRAQLNASMHQTFGNWNTQPARQTAGSSYTLSRNDYIDSQARAQSRHNTTDRPRQASHNLHNTQPYGGQQTQPTSSYPSQSVHTPTASQAVERGTNPRNAHGVRLRPTSDLPDIYRSLFRFGVFNAVQSTCYDTVMSSNDNMVISAPTGSGKTVLFELAIVRMHMQSSTTGKRPKCVYVAPTKALCSEKHRDWETKFTPMGIKCCELTGDTVQFGKSAWGDARDASIIVTTGEKWDSLTRNWEDHEQTLSQVTLFLVDEVHILNESRGSTLEVVISRMKARGSCVRFVMVSATVPNIADVAAWIGNGRAVGPAVVMQFGDEYRPCKLAKFVYGIPRKREQNDFMFARVLDYRLYGILKDHSVDKPVLVFCSTRKGVFATAEQLAKEYEEASKQRQTLPWTRPRRIERNFHDKRLEKLAACGIGVHHAGLSPEDRRSIEDLFINKLLRVVVATSTLAVGVNLPAHTVVIKGVKIYQGGNGSQEYSDLDIMQMLGRAGRPQFDKEGIAVIMCERDLEHKYKAMAQGNTILESCLHLNLAEHLNSEIGLGTITNLRSAEQWLHNSFLYQRIQRNPAHYSIGKGGDQTWEERMNDMVAESIDTLKKDQLVTQEDDDSLSSTEYGEIMSKYYIRQSTMSAILKLPNRVAMKDLIELLATSEEFSDIKIRSGEKQIFNKIRTLDEIRYKPKKVEKAADKISLIIQSVLGGISLNDAEFRNGDNQPHLEALGVFRHISRIARATVDVGIARQSGSHIKYGMELVRCLNAKAWEDRPVVLRQIEHIGEKSLKVLAQHGITTFDKLRKQDPLRIEALLSRRPPFGLEVLSFVNQLPQYWVEITEASKPVGDGKGPVEVELTVKCGLTEDCSAQVKAKGKNKYRDATLILTTTSDLDFVDFRKISTKALRETKDFNVTAQVTKPSQSIVVIIASESIAGVTVSATYKPSIAANQYPVMQTRPMTSMEMDLEGLEDDPDFWKSMEEGPSDDEIVVPTVDLTKGPTGRKVAQSPVSKKIASQVDLGESFSQSRKEPEKLPNGNYACAHTCKDKSACKHLCCREGTEKPTQGVKKRVDAGSSTKKPTTAEPPASHTKIKPIPKPRANPQKQSDVQLRQLETLHQKAGVQANLNLPAGRRIKLDSATSSTVLENISKLKKKPVPAFDHNFSDIKGGDELVSIADLEESSDEDLPDTREILAAHDARKKKPDTNTASSETYTAEDIDELIRTLPYSDPVEVELMDVDELNSPAKPEATPSPSRKRKSEATPPRRSGKRQKVDVPKKPSADSPRRKKGQVHPSRTVHTNQPLFLATPDRGLATSPERTANWKNRAPEAPAYQADEEFVLDETLFDIVPNDGSELPSNTASTTQSKDPDLTMFEHSPSQLNRKETPFAIVPDDVSKLPSKASPSTTQPKDSNMTLFDRRLSQLYRNKLPQQHDSMSSVPVHKSAPQTNVQREPTPKDDWEERWQEFFDWLESDAVIIAENGDGD